MCVCLRVVCLQGCVSVRPWQVLRGGGGAGAQRLVGPLCEFGGGEFAAPLVPVNCGGGPRRSLGETAMSSPSWWLGGGGWAAGRWTDGGMRGRGVDRWARGRDADPALSHHPTPVPSRPDLCRWGWRCPYPDGRPGDLWASGGRIASDQVLFSSGPQPSEL